MRGNWIAEMQQRLKEHAASLAPLSQIQRQACFVVVLCKEEAISSSQVNHVFWLNISFILKNFLMETFLGLAYLSCPDRLRRSLVQPSYPMKQWREIWGFGFPWSACHLQTGGSHIFHGQTACNSWIFCFNSSKRSSFWRVVTVFSKLQNLSSVHFPTSQLLFIFLDHLHKVIISSNPMPAWFEQWLYWGSRIRANASSYLNHHGRGGERRKAFAAVS